MAGPLTVTQLTCLIAVSKGKTYGLRVIGYLESVLGRGLSGTVYKCLNRLEKLGYLTSEVESVSTHQGPARRYYTLTNKGREILKQLVVDVKEDE